jgi:DNA-binding XRE family transcriptional regulator
MDNKEFSKIRHELDLTQKGLSRVLCVSPKAIQSFEQGWRDVPVHIEREMLLLLALKGFRNRDRIPDACWEIKNCPAGWREKCLVWKLQARHFCWYLNGTFCQGKAHQNWEEKHIICRQCEVYQSMFSNYEA